LIYCEYIASLFILIYTVSCRLNTTFSVWSIICTSIKTTLIWNNIEVIIYLTYILYLIWLSSWWKSYSKFSITFCWEVNNSYLTTISWNICFCLWTYKYFILHLWLCGNKYFIFLIISTIIINCNKLINIHHFFICPMICYWLTPFIYNL